MALNITVPETLALPSRSLETGDVLYQAGRKASLLYIVTSGILKGVVPTSVGRERIADLYGIGDILGFEVLDAHDHAETVTALQECNLIPFDPKHALYDKTMRRTIVYRLASQLRRSREVLADIDLPVGARVSNALLRLGRRFGQAADSKEGIKLPLPLTHEDLASLLSSSRVTITRVIGELRETGALSGTRGIYVIDPELLEQATDDYVFQVL